MRIWNGPDHRPPDAGERYVASIGNYDGVHLGHREILERVVGDAGRAGGRALLVTFDPHPLTVVAPDRRPPLLQTRRQKIAALEETGLDDLLIVPFDASIARLDGPEFFETVLGSVRFDAIHVGVNFRFGRDRAGDVDTLRAIGAARGFRVEGVPQVRQGDSIVSSSEIRRRVAAGDVEGARRMLGRPYAVEGRVVRGDGRGRDLAAPTANLDVENELTPADGVYVTEVRVDAVRMPSVTNVGSRPTFGGRERRVESHLIDFDEPLYERRLEIRFLARLRDEQRFDTPAELADQIARDRAAAEAYFTNLQLQFG